ncbi:chorismate mutase/prephenate dehydratase [Methylococcus capsulatus str. Bath]|uniref:Bifunctional chorismate mutase/prephenate dehydratase n=1 Tax=Methylococcus capsulatus (strain ATCC 33009 / NCIMB 11132 / Bath) TaxID=243233 RepID=Q608S2_METCA|nr:prephenate dehydratase [Methylococcus capsulatus]AAU92297.1 chorismate mutase/prephenate dehydratase [Methylococcus capsulatus str. Bath]
MANDPSLAELRKRIDELDDRVLELLNQRARCAQRVADIKVAAGETDCFYRPEREAEILQRLTAHNPGPLGREAVVRFFREVMSECLALEKPLSVAFLGPEGTFTQQAAYRHFGHAIQAVPMPAIDEIFRAVESGACHYGVVPVENSTEGVITHTLDSFVRFSLIIAGEVQLRIHHNLLCRTPTALTELTEVFSHPQSLAQCRGWLDRFLPGVRRTPLGSNAEAARRAAETAGTAAIAGEVAAGLYGLEILNRNIEDEPDNTTRFLVIGGQPVGPTGHDKTSLLLSTRNDPGALFRLIEPFARLGISMTKIESRPSRRGMWDYFFFIDVEGHQADPTLAQALAEVREHCCMMRILGSYPRALS